MNQITKEISLLKKEKINTNESFDFINGCNIIIGFYIICWKNQINDILKLEYTIEKTRVLDL